MNHLTLFLAAALLAAGCTAQVPTDTPAEATATDRPLRPSAWLQHDMTRPAPPRAEPAPGDRSTPAPPGATVLIGPDGAGLDAWEAPDGSPAPWVQEGGAVVAVPGSGPIQTKASFGDLQLHIEWQAADEPQKTGQDRSNSGVFLLDGRYEVQILDGYDNRTYADGTAGAIYGQYPPLVNALRPSDAWQAYDIFFRAPRFAGDGTVREPARLTVLINGLLVQNNELLSGMTMWLETLPYASHPGTGKIQLQDHGSPVRFRNLWVRETPDRPAPPADYGRFEAQALSDADYDRLVGTYDREGGGVFVVERTADGLGLSMPWRTGILRMIPLSPTRFQLMNTAGVLTFTLDDQDHPTALAFEMGGSTYRATPVAE